MCLYKNGFFPTIKYLCLKYIITKSKIYSLFNRKEGICNTCILNCSKPTPLHSFTQKIEWLNIRMNLDRSGSEVPVVRSSHVDIPVISEPIWKLDNLAVVQIRLTFWLGARGCLWEVKSRNVFVIVCGVKGNFMVISFIWLLKLSQVLSYFPYWGS